ncbi:MAG TPA: hypothetical protein VFV27_10415, partial [Nevskiaceae bacterium]|nr:hypothetical protein [Nevskiaceae bacterium]
ERTLDTLRSQLQAPELKAGPERARLDQQLQSFELSLVDQLKGAAALRAERETLCANAAADLKRFGELRKLTTSEPACPAIGSLVEEGMASEDQVPEGAKALVARLQTLERSFDPGLLDLYAVDATITNRRKGKDGKPVDTVVALDKHRSTLTAALKKAQPKNQPRTYSRIRYAPLSGGRYKLTAERVDAPKAKPVTVMMLLVPQPDESWKIQREIVETR